MDHAETVALLWPDPQPPKRGPKPRITLEQIVQTGIELADADGLDSVSMQRIADRLGVTKMSLYRYAPGKGALLALMLDRALDAPPEDLAAASDWRAGLRSWAFAMHGALAAHPWAIALAVGIRPFGPNELRWTEVGLRVLGQTDLARADRLDALALVAIHVRGMVQESGGDDAVERGIGEIMTAVLEARVVSFPEVSAAFSEAAAAGGQDEALGFGLERILDGLERFMAEPK
ncbi:TetR/AcrR family transcriptional regulator [Microlunatus speluncae]|uniref:TetR/AcrR family transcriptional regulator n=1 Tax=Microlunatus speluncae TaxID=2594267 RepID=UPI0012665092|nr:TetR/AcrR family transcriptional regulator [Microlunatus speluncae]